MQRNLSSLNGTRILGYHYPFMLFLLHLNRNGALTVSVLFERDHTRLYEISKLEGWIGFLIPEVHGTSTFN